MVHTWNLASGRLKEEDYREFQANWATKQDLVPSRTKPERSTRWQHHTVITRESVPPRQAHHYSAVNYPPKPINPKALSCAVKTGEERQKGMDTFFLRVLLSSLIQEMKE